MRLWSLHPGYLDAKGLVAAWREGLLAQKVLEGRTKGYTKHPQLSRFRASCDPLSAIGLYLAAIAAEGESRRYRFDREKILEGNACLLAKVPVSVAQIEYEFELLKWKLEKRDMAKFRELLAVASIEPSAAFTVHGGDIAEWEKPLPEVLSRIVKYR
jgi:hypothetical protein